LKHFHCGVKKVQQLLNGGIVWEKGTKIFVCCRCFSNGNKNVYPLNLCAFEGL
jgi:hypothetical protein